MNPNPLIGVVLGSGSDMPVVKKGLEVLESLDIPFEARILSAHRTPEKAVEYARTARARGIRVLIGAAGRAAHLPGVMASHTVLPVIGLPIGGGPLEGVDALYSIVQMPSGVPVGAVAIDGAANAALLAAEILAVADDEIAARLEEMRKTRAQKGAADDAALQEKGWKGF